MCGRTRRPYAHFHSCLKDADHLQFYKKNVKFEYRFIPFPGMGNSWSVKTYGGDPLGAFDPNLVNYSMYPFDDLPTFELHVPYHFVIVNTGKKLVQLYGMDTADFEADFPFLSPADRIMMRAVRNIYVAWMNAQPDLRWCNGEKYDNEQDSPVEGTRRGGAGSDSSRQRRSGPSGGKGGGDQAQDAVAGASGAPRGRRRATAESLTPWDSASCLEPFEPVDEGDGEDENKPFVDDEDEEYEDEEFFEGLKLWASDVWSAMHSDTGSDSEVTLVGGATRPALSKGVEATTSPPLPLLSI